MGSGRPLEEQSDWPAHAAFMDGLVDDGFVVLGGPLADEHRVVHVIEAKSEDGIRERLRAGSVERVSSPDRGDRPMDDPPRRPALWRAA